MYSLYNRVCDLDTYLLLPGGPGPRPSASNPLRHHPPPLAARRPTRIGASGPRLQAPLASAQPAAVQPLVGTGLGGHPCFDELGPDRNEWVSAKWLPRGCLGSRTARPYGRGRGSVMRAEGMRRGASGRSVRDSAPEARPSEVRRFLGPDPSSPLTWNPSRASSASTAAVSAQGMRKVLPTDPPPGPVL